MLNEQCVRRGARIITQLCGQVNPHNRVLIICNDSTKDVGTYLFEAARKLTDKTKWIEIKQGTMHGEEPTADVAQAMMVSDVIFGATLFSLAHTKARINATNRGAKYISLPDYSLEQLCSPALLVDFSQQGKNAMKIKHIFDVGRRVRVTTKKGTDITLDISERVANYCPGFCDKPGMLGSPPDIETNIAPVEDKSVGILFVDGSIPCREIGLIKEDIKIKIEHGMIKEIDNSVEQGKMLEDLLNIEANRKTGILAEFGIGLNPKAELCGRMLEDEGCYGTIHFGFGSNSTMGGKNDVNFHLDFVIKNPTITIDGAKIMEGGILE